ncbi:MAG: hypothetical protein J5861_08130 [Desulfovibrio sp.]|nr:hypothetical protein [Desulfovibrio sp.]
MEVLPGGRSVGRTPEGGMGYTDAYGNTISSRVPENNSARSRLRTGAFGVMRAAPRPDRPLPDSSHQSPAWSFK